MDDNAIAREIFEDLLTSMSFDVTLAESGEEGISKLEEASGNNPFDLVLMDWQMPGMNGVDTSRQIRRSKSEIRNVKIILATAYDHEELAQQAEKVGINGFLPKPVNPSFLLNAIMEAFGKGIPGGARSRKREDAVEGLDQIQGARILLAEDNEVNQQVAQEILEGSGFVVEIAENGQEAVDMVLKGTVELRPYDVVLMDINMPVMDGLEATRRIRDLEGSSQSPLPIVAMTASAMTQDIELTQEAGMNGHVAKPIDVKQLFSTLVKWIEPGEREVPFEYLEIKETPKALEETLPFDELEGIDVEDGLKRVGGKKKFYKKILKKFRAGNLEVMAEIREEISRKNLEQAERLVHGIKGASGNIGATELFESTRILDDALKLEKTDGMDQMMARFSSAFQQVMDSIAGLEEEEGAMDTDSEPVAMDRTKVTEIMTHLKALLEDDDAEAAKLLDSLEEQLRVPEALLHLQELTSHIASYDFEEALETLELLARDLEINI